MNRTRLRPVPQDLHRNDPYLPELMRYINRLLGGDVAEHIARNASLLYLALVTGFVENDLLQESWAPRIVINVGNQEYEIALGDTEESSVTEVVRQTKSLSSSMEVESRDDKRQVGIKYNKALALLDALEARGTEHQRKFGQATASEDAQFRTLKPEDTLLSVHHGLACSSQRPDQAQIIMQHVLRLDLLDGRVNGLSMAINAEYYRLGVCFEAYTESHHSAGGKPIGHPRTEKARSFERLCAEPALHTQMASPTTRSTLKKRLRRGRKFALLVRIFGAGILSAVPEVSVSRVDQVRVEDLLAFSKGTTGAAKIKRILQKMDTS